MTIEGRGGPGLQLGRYAVWRSCPVRRRCLWFRRVGLVDDVERSTASRSVGPGVRQASTLCFGFRRAWVLSTPRARRTPIRVGAGCGQAAALAGVVRKDGMDLRPEIGSEG